MQKRFKVLLILMVAATVLIALAISIPQNRQERLIVVVKEPALSVRVENMRGWTNYTLQVFFYYEETTIAWGVIKEEGWQTGLTEFLTLNSTRLFQFNLDKTIEGFAVIPKVEEVVIYLERGTIIVATRSVVPLEV